MTREMEELEATVRNTALQPMELNDRQLIAVDALVVGATDEEAATAAGVHRVTVSRWKNNNPMFIAALNGRRRELRESSIEKLRALLPKAVERLEREIESGPDGLKAALELVKLTRLAEQRAKPYLVDPLEVFDAMIRDRRRRFDDQVLTDYGHGPITHEERLSLLKELHERGAFKES
jgi:hypothetical protein